MSFTQTIFIVLHDQKALWLYFINPRVGLLELDAKHYAVFPVTFSILEKIIKKTLDSQVLSLLKQEFHNTDTEHLDNHVCFLT